MKNVISNTIVIAMPLIVCMGLTLLLPAWVTQGIIMFLCLVIIATNMQQHGETE